MHSKDFMWAFMLMLKGKRMFRTGWNGKHQYVAVQYPDENSKMTQAYCYLVNNASGIVPWVPSQGDLFADDWEELD